MWRHQVLWGWLFGIVLLLSSPTVEAFICFSAHLEITPAAYDYGAVDLGSDKAKQFNITYNRFYTMHEGSCACNCDSPTTAQVSISSDDGRYDLSTSNLSINAGQTKSVIVTFEPDQVGTIGGIVTAIVTNDGDVPAWSKVSNGTANVAGVGYVPQPIIDLDPLAMDFDEVIINDSEPQIITISNDGDATLNVSDIEVTSNAAEFSVSGSTSFSVAPGNDRDVTINFSPDGTGSREGQLRIDSNDPDSDTLYVNLSGTGVKPIFSVSQGSVSFADTPVGSTASQDITISNLNSAFPTNLNIASIVSSNGQFWAVPDSLSNIAPGDEETVTIYYAPSSAGNHGANLTFNSNDPNSPDVVILDGTGVSSQIDASTLTLDYGDTLLGTDNALNLTIQNTGALTLNVTNITSSDGSFAPSTTSFSLTPAAQKQISVTFSPTVNGTKNETLTIYSNDPGASELEIALNGTGANPNFQPVLADANLGIIYNDSNKDTDLTLENQGSYELVVTNVTGSSAEVVPMETSFSIPPGGSHEFPIRFHPSQIGPRGASLTFYTNQYGALNQQILVTCESVSQLDLSVSSLEVTQSIQTMDNSVPLVAGKDTLVRAYIDATVRGESTFSNWIYGVDGVLIVRRDGSQVSGSPFKSSNGPIALTDIVDREELNQTLNFFLPKSISNASSTSDLSFEFEVNPASGSHVAQLEENDDSNNELSEDLKFKARYQPKIDYVPISYFDNGLPDADEIEEDERRLVSIFPLASVDSRWRPPIQFNLDLNAGDPLHWEYARALLDAVFYASHLGGGAGPGDRAYGWLVPYSMDKICGMADGIPARTGFGEPHSRCDVTFAHEIGHTYGLCHTQHHDFCGDGHIEGDVDLDETGIDVTAQQLMPESEYYDVMSYSWPRWIQTQRYKHLFNDLEDQADDPANFVSIDDFGLGSLWMISGYLSDSGSGDIHPIYEGHGYAHDIENIQGGNHCQLRAVDEDGQELWSIPLQDPTEGGEKPGDRTRFAFAIPQDPNVTGFELLLDGGVVATLNKSDNAPILEIESPAANSQVGDLLEVQWQAEDADGDDLLYSVLFSADGGENYHVIGVDLEQMQFAYDSTQLPGTENGWVKVITTDGMNNASDMIGPIKVSSKPPQVTLLSPHDGQSYVRGAVIPLRAIGRDLEAGELGDSAFEWFSDIDNSLGQGTDLDPTSLSLGEHTITVRVTDSDLEVSEAEVTIRVISADEDPRAIVSLNQRVSEGEILALDGSRSYHPEGDVPLSYKWKKISGPTVTLDDDTAVQPTFTAPSVDKDTLMRFRLTVTDPDGNSSQAVANVTVRNTKYPVMNILNRTLDFGVRAVGHTEDKTFKVRNDGDKALNITSMKASRDVFTVLSGSMTIQPGATETYTIRFQPDEEAEYESFLNIRSNSGPGVATTVVMVGETPNPLRRYDDYAAGGSLFPVQQEVLTSESEEPSDDDVVVDPMASPDAAPTIGFGGSGCSLIR